MNKIITTLVVSLSFILPTSASAADQKVIAIIDTAVDSSKNANVIYEVCFTGSSCPNGKNFMEGKGAANVFDWKVTGIDHGHNISSVVVKNDPSVKIVFIRITDILTYNNKNNMITDGAMLDKAISWVAANATKYSIDAVSISQARNNFAKGTCPKDLILEQSVANLSKINVATFAAAGNNGLVDHLSFPACAAGIYSVGAYLPNGSLTPYTHKGLGVKLIALGNSDIKAYGGWDITVTGTSIATPTAATKLLSVWNGEPWSELINKLSKQDTYLVVK